jgi:branched-subunit amino acid aminotransferase/4-amino-4-deoxychorismate lyase
VDFAVAAGPGSYLEIDGQDATGEQLSAAALAHYGHFTAMQVRDRRVRGLELHLARLDRANREMFGAAVDAPAVRAHVRHALGADRPDASVRIYLYQTPAGISVMVTVRPPGAMPATPWRLRTVPYQRPVAHIKHMCDFGQSYFQRLAIRNGFDEALLTGADGAVSEGSITNVGFFDGEGIVWPAAPALPGITMQLLQQALPGLAMSAHRRPVRTADLGTFTAAFVTNARGIAPVAQIDDLVLPVNHALIGKLRKAYESAGWDRI